MMKITDFSAQEPEGIEKRHNTTAIQVVDGVKRLINVQTGEELYSLTHGRFNSYHYKKMKVLFRFTERNLICPNSFLSNIVHRL